MKRVIISVLVISLGLLLKSCNTTEPPPPPPPNGTTVFNTINLAVEWTDLHRIKIKWNISIKDTQHNYRYELSRKDETGGEVTKNFFISGSDTSYIDGETDSLASGKEFNYKVRAYDSNDKLIDTSKTVTAKTLAPTSHNITWTIDTLGHAGNFLNDVWGLDENNVYAVGYVSLNGNNSNVIKWNGLNWTTFSLVEGVLQGIYGFDENNIIVVGTYGSYGYSAIWNGSNWNETNFFRYFPNGDTVWALRSVWGSSPDDVWAVGDFGTIIHWDGTEWRKVVINLPSDRAFWDVWGTDESNVYAVTLSLSDQSELFHYDGNQWTEVTTQLPSMERSLTSIWIDKNNTGYLAGNTTIYYDGSNWNYIYINQTRFLTRVRGSNSANVFIGGQRGRVHHFNGVNWLDYPELFADTGQLNEIKGIQVFDEKVFLVGYTDKALVYRGTNKR